MDPITGIGAASAAKAVDATSAEAAKVAGNLLTRLLGPSADIVGAQWAEALKQKNLERLLRKTEKRAAGKDDPGIANPRLASQVFEGAQFADDEVVAEYYSGILASSRDHLGRNDSGVGWSSLINRLSSDQLRLHYLIYASVRPAVLDAAITDTNALHGRTVVLPFAAVWTLGGFGNLGEFGRSRIMDAIDGLMRENLIGGSYGYGDNDYVVQSASATGMYLDLPYDRCLKVDLTIHGIRLFLWGMGVGEGEIEQYWDPAVSIDLVDEESGLGPIEGAAFWSDALKPKKTDSGSSGR